MDREVWEQTYFTFADMPKWGCPFCNNANLKIHSNIGGEPIFYFEEAQVKKNLDEKRQPAKRTIGSHFIGMLQCINCKGIISFHGAGAHTATKIYNDDGECIRIDYADLFYPQGFSPFVRIFPVPPECPPKVRKLIHDSFRVFWLDNGSCANRIRAVIEQLLSNLDIKYFDKNGQKTLKMRIKEYSLLNPEIGKKLSSISLIGNIGSHMRSKVGKPAILDAYEMLESILNELYDKKVTDTGEILP